MKDCQVLNMKLLIVLGLFPLFSASPFHPLYPTGGLGPANNVFLGSFNINHQDLGRVRVMADSLIADLRSLNADPNSASIIRRIFKTKNNVCLRDMNEAITAIQEGARLVENASGDIRSLISKVENLMGERDEAKTVREVASIMRSLQPLLTKIAPSRQELKICKASPDQTSAYLRSLAVLLEEISNNPQLPLGPDTRAMMVYSGSLVSGVTTFINQLRANAMEFQSVCSANRQFGMRGITALGNIMVNLADMTSALAGVRTGEEIRKGKLIAERIVVS